MDGQISPNRGSGVPFSSIMLRYESIETLSFEPQCMDITVWMPVMLLEKS